MPIQGEIIEYLQKEYNAKAILLHGSRARNNPHQRSDWDLLVFTDDVFKGNGGDKFEGQDLDIKVIKLPIVDMDEFISSYPQSLQCIKVLLDNDEGIANKILLAAKERYSQPPGITEKDRENMRHHFDRMLGRLIDFRDDSEVFFYQMAVFYTKSIRFWFQYQNLWPKTIVESLKVIENEDEVFMKGLKIISDYNKSADKKLKAADRMVKAVLSKA